MPETPTREEMLKAAVKNDIPAFCFLNDIITIFHLWDDLIDKDKTRTDSEINLAFWMALVELPNNSFYRANFHLLNPLVMMAIQNWQVATAMERGKGQLDLEIAFIIRSSYVDLILQSALIVGGRAWAEQTAPEIRRYAHGETFAGYLKNLEAEELARKEASHVL